MNRREFIEWVKNSGIAFPFLSTFPLLFVSSEKIGSAPNPKHRFINIFLNGGCDCNLGTAPVIGPKVTSPSFDPAYQTFPVTTVPGKSNLVVGPGLAGSIDAFKDMPTAFVNGLFVEVTAHDLAVKYVQSGVLSLSRGRDYPSVGPILGQGRLPSFVNIGARSPLGYLKSEGTEIYSRSVQELKDLLEGPRAQSASITPTGFQHTDDLIDGLHNIFLKKLTTPQKKALNSWANARTATRQIASQGYHQWFQSPPAYYNAAGPLSGPAQLHAAYLILKSGLSPYVTLNIGFFDHHTDTGVFQQQLAEYTNILGALPALVSDLKNTPDPLEPGKSLADNTTIAILTEFNRTPIRNLGNGTDHWDTGSAILMGRGVADNVVVGGTDLQAKALGWSGGTTVPRTSDSKLLPEHLISTIFSIMGRDEMAQKISSKQISELIG